MYTGYLTHNIHPIPLCKPTTHQPPLPFPPPPPPPPHLLRQRPHHRLKRHQSHRIRRESPQKARTNPPPIPPHTLLPVHPPRCLSPSAEPPLGPQRIRHDALLHHVTGVGRDPKDLRGQPAGPEINGWSGERGMCGEGLRENLVRPPPEEEEGAEEEGGGEAVVDAF